MNSQGNLETRVVPKVESKKGEKSEVYGRRLKEKKSITGSIEGSVVPSFMVSIESDSGFRVHYQFKSTVELT